MNATIELHIDSDVAAQARTYAENTGRTLSQLVEKHLRALTSCMNDQIENGKCAAPVTESLIGIIPNIDPTKDTKELIREAKDDYLRTKHNLDW